jgi:hypothetical protein
MKKTYRILEELCSRSTLTIQQFIDENRSNFLLEHLLASLTKSQSALKGVCSFSLKRKLNLLVFILATNSLYFKFT